MLSKQGAAPLLRAAGPALCWCPPDQTARLFGSRRADAAPAGPAAAPAAIAVDNVAAAEHRCTSQHPSHQRQQPCPHRHQRHATSASACRGALAQHVRCLACGGWHAVPAAARAQPPPRSLPLLSTHGGRPCYGLTISLAEDMAIEVRIRLCRGWRITAAASPTARTLASICPSPSKPCQ